MKQYKPVATYIGTPFRIGWVKEAVVEADTVTLVVPFKGAKGKANLVIHGKKSAKEGDNELVHVQTFNIIHTYTIRSQGILYHRLIFSNNISSIKL